MQISAYVLQGEMLQVTLQIDEKSLGGTIIVTPPEWEFLSSRLGITPQPNPPHGLDEGESYWAESKFPAGV